jgi:multicomponent K+:H+ antiporter subunit F
MNAHGPILIVALSIALACLIGAMLFALGRMLIGPTAQDRVLALDNLYLNGMLVMLVLGLIYRSPMYFEAALLIALLGFAATLAMAKFLLRGEVIE